MAVGVRLVQDDVVGVETRIARLKSRVDGDDRPGETYGETGFRRKVRRDPDKAGKGVEKLRVPCGHWSLWWCVLGVR